ncbi:uncharacterized protein LOC122499022 [Leptopilina heterotoma]|uniref:uncharacterized protein LOC122499022 n=1 Tax=Leptopilina heterotoma TaxID=63436 RepID=UPI001CA9879B|nr:uncharacterized protein LOC122499022 [Leptopilina heterotoma]
MTLKVYFIVTISVSLCLGSEEYVQLISNIYEFSNRTSVTLIHFGSTDDSSKKQLIFDTQVLLLKKGFPVSNTNFKKLDSIKKKEYDSVEKFYESDRLLIVFFVSSLQDFSDMLHITKLMKRKKVITFLLFVKIDDSPDLPSCMNPVGNPLRLGRGVSVLVKCYEDPDIREWHSVNNNEILIKKRATWIPKKGITSISKRLVFGDREFLRGKTLLAASIRESDTIGNYFSMICVALEEAGNFKIKKTHIVADYGILDERTNTWNGAVSLIMNETVDMAVGFFTFLPSGLRVVDYTVGFVRAEFVLIIRKPESRVLVSWSAHFQTFSLQVWIFIICTVILLQIVCILMKNNSPTQCYDKSSYTDDFFNIYGIFCHQEVMVTTSATSIRILYTSVAIFSFFIWSIYCAGFVSKLTVVDSNVKFRSMEEFVKVKTHKLIVFKETSNYVKLKNATEPTFIEAAKLLVNEDQLPTNNDDAVEMICKHNMALYINDIFVPLVHYTNISNLCPMLTIRTGDFDSFVFLLNKHSPYKAAINYYLRRFHENGMLDRMKPAIYSSTPKFEEFDNQFTSVTAVAVAMIFTMLFASFIVSIIMLLFEKLYFFLERTNEKNLQTILNSISRKKLTISVSLCLGSEEYVQLISNIYEFSNRTSVTLIHFGSTDDSSKKQLIFDTQVLLLKKGFPVSNTNFKKLDSIKKKEYDSVDKFYGNDKILIVFFVSSMQDFSDMLHITKLMKRKKVITFLLFVKIDDSPDLPSCMNPVGNPLRLGRGVSVLVKCYEDPDIREWHSVNNNEILIKERATWDFKRGFTSKSRRLVFGDREFLRGKTLLAASISETDTMGNYLSMICVALEEAGKFKIKKTHIVVDYGILDERTNTWDGAVSLIMNNTVDIAVGFFTFLPSELLVVDFSIRFIRAEFAIIIRKPESKVLVSWSAYFENATESTFIEAAKLLVSEDQLPTNNDDAVEMICKQNMALYLDDIFVPLMYHNNVSNLCPMLTIGTGDFDSFAFLVNKHSPYKAAINYYLRRFHENGMLPRMKPAIYSPAPKIEEFDNQFTSVTAVAVAMIFTMLFKINMTLKVYFIVTISVSLCLGSEEYVQLISNIYEYSNRSSVTLLHFGSTDDSSKKQLIFDTQVLLLKKGFPVSNTNFKKLNSIKKNEYYSLKNFYGNDKILIVFFVSSMQDFSDMLHITTLMRRKRVITFLLFVKIDDSPDLPSCMNPVGNPLRLSRGVSVLVKCYEDPDIREWHSVNNNEILIKERATWDLKRGFTSKSRRLVLGAREFLRGKTLLAASIRKTDTIGNYFGMLFAALEKAGNFTIKKTNIIEDYGALDERTNKWNGAVSLIMNKTVDIAVGFFTFLPSELLVVDFSIRFIRAEFAIIIRKPESRVLVSWSAYFQPFSLQIWILIICTIILLQIVCILMKNTLPTQCYEKSSYADDFFNIYGIFCRQEVTVTTSATSIRILYISVVIFSFFIWSIYSARFVSKLTIVDSNVKFRTMEEFVKVKTHKLIVFKETSNYFKLKNATESTFIEAAKLLVNEDQLPTNNDDAVEMICKQNMALYSDDTFVPLMYHNNVSNLCPMLTIGTGDFDSFSFLLNKHSPYKSAINYYIRRFFENGVMARLKPAIYSSVPKIEEFDNEFTHVTVIAVAMLFAMLFAGYIISITMLLFENLHFLLERTKKQNIFFRKSYKLNSKL